VRRQPPVSVTGGVWRRGGGEEGPSLGGCGLVRFRLLQFLEFLAFVFGVPWVVWSAWLVSSQLPMVALQLHPGARQLQPRSCTWVGIRNCAGMAWLAWFMPRPCGLRGELEPARLIHFPA
jgi:hypothetical protein